MYEIRGLASLLETKNVNFVTKFRDKRGKTDIFSFVIVLGFVKGDTISKLDVTFNILTVGVLSYLIIYDLLALFINVIHKAVDFGHKQSFEKRI